MAHRVAGEQYYDLDGQLLEIKRQLRQRAGYPYDPNELRKHLQSIITGKFYTTLALIARDSKERNIIMDRTDGTGLLSRTQEQYIFSSTVDFDIREYDQPTEIMPVSIFALMENATFTQMFGSLLQEPEDLFFTQAQVKSFILKNQDWLHEDCITHIPFKYGGIYLVANVSFKKSDDIPSVIVHNSKAPQIYSGMCGTILLSRIVVPCY
ncbi:MAG: hypothetical protein ACD_67C00147G0002 [uncultured bacterium]|nr:MAG: hypothetical protein ACD_67C00147G0002 [uncultured bacterium]